MHLLVHILQVKAANPVNCGGKHLGTLLIPDFSLAGRVFSMTRGVRAFFEDLLLVMQRFCLLSHDIFVVTMRGNEDKTA